MSHKEEKQNSEEIVNEQENSPPKLDFTKPLEPLPKQRGIDITQWKDKGIMKRFIRKPTDIFHPSKDDIVSVHYDAYFKDSGIKFDSSRTKGEPLKFKLGARDILRLFDQGVATMKQGEVCRLECDYDYAYGMKGSKVEKEYYPRPMVPVPPRTWVYYDVELLGWEYGEDLSWDMDGSVTRSRQILGVFESRHPNEGSLIKVKIIGYYDGKVFMDGEFEWELGESTESGIPDGVDIAVRRFKRLERSLLLVAPKWAYGKEGKPEWGIPPYATLVFDVTLLESERALDPWARGQYDKLKEAERLKAKGTQNFKKGNYRMALAKYEAQADILSEVIKGGMGAMPGKGGANQNPPFMGADTVQMGQGVNSDWGQHKELRDELYVAAKLNTALCYLKMDEGGECVRQCKAALKEKLTDETKIKAIYRKAQGHQSISEFDQAIGDYQKVLEMEPENKAAQQQINECKKRKAKAKTRDKDIYRGIFRRMEAENAKMQQEEEEETDDANDSNGQTLENSQ